MSTLTARPKDPPTRGQVCKQRLRWLSPRVTLATPVTTAWPALCDAQPLGSASAWPLWASVMVGGLLIVAALLALLIALVWRQHPRPIFFRTQGPAPADGQTTPSPTSPAAAKPSRAAEVGDTAHESFGYTVSHDLRAPIRVVEGFTKILKEDYGPQLDRIGNDHLERILGAATRMNHMIDALLALSHLSKQPLGHQTVDLSQLANYVAEDLRRQYPQRDVTLRIEPGLKAQGDPTLLRVVLENLLGNAWKYTGKREHAEIALIRNPVDANIYTVCDNGAGFDMRFADRLFGVFQRLHSANDFAGTGVGLASVRRIVRRHGGDIWAEAEVDRGARFHFSLGTPPGSPQQTSQRPH